VHLNIFVCADSYGEIQPLVERIESSAEKFGKPDWVLHVGNFGVWPDPRHTDRTTARGQEYLDFIEYYSGRFELPYPILFLPGAHEDHGWLESMYMKGHTEIVPNLHRLLPGFKHYVRTEAESVSVLGLPRVFSPKVYQSARRRKNRSHYTKEEVERACAQGPVDIFLSTEAGAGNKVKEFESVAEGINSILFATRPKIHFHAHYNTFQIYKNSRTSTFTISLPRHGIIPIRYNKEQGQLIVPSREGGTL